MERERNEEYLRLIKDVANHFETTDEKMDIVNKKGLLKILFKSIKIDNGRISDFELYEPYKSLYEGVPTKWELQENQILMTEKANVSTLLPSADRWFRSHRTILPFLQEVYQDKLAELTSYAPKG
jgi:hypothetical protein